MKDVPNRLWFEDILRSKRSRIGSLFEVAVEDLQSKNWFCFSGDFVKLGPY